MEGGGTWEWKRCGSWEMNRRRNRTKYQPTWTACDQVSY